MAKRTFVMLAQSDIEHITPSGWFLSEKLDGMRCIWDGGMSRDLLASTVPYANTAKDGRLLSPPTATGLWSRYGKVISAPDWFLDTMPVGVCLDGELWTKRDDFQNLISAVKGGSRWSEVTYRMFDIPAPQRLFADGKINEIHYKKVFKDILPWYLKMGGVDYPQLTLRSNYELLEQMQNDRCIRHEQMLLSWKAADARNQIQISLRDICNEAGEGIMLRHPDTMWETERSWNLIKQKPWLDAEGVIIGHNPGKDRNEGRLGSLSIRTTSLKDVVVFKLSGMDDSLRDNPPPIGTEITFKYRKLTRDKIPYEARFWRVRNDIG